MNAQPGDFWYFDATDVWLIEAKACSRGSFPIERLRPEQHVRLQKFRDSGAGRHSVVALNFYGTNIRLENELYLVELADYDRLLTRAGKVGRFSLPQEWVEEVGFRQARVAGNLWAIDFERVKHGQA